jgi:hypothetical protein
VQPLSASCQLNWMSYFDLSLFSVFSHYGDCYGCCYQYFTKRNSSCNAAFPIFKNLNPVSIGIFSEICSVFLGHLEMMSILYLLVTNSSLFFLARITKFYYLNFHVAGITQEMVTDKRQIKIQRKI